MQNVDPAHAHFRRGVAALAAGKPIDAVEHFQAALTADKAKGSPRPPMRYISYYGLSLALADRPTAQAVKACERAAARDSFDPVLFLNLGRVYLLAGMTTKALATFERGLRLDPGHRALRAALSGADRRSKPPLSMLSRDNPLNRSLGKLRAQLFARRA